jgi:hypothetical protein
MKRYLFAIVVTLFGCVAWSQTPPGAYGPSSGGGGSSTTSVSAIPGFPGVTSVPITSGLMAEYRMLPTENPCALVDYSGNGNNGTGCSGTAPTIIAVTGGMNFNGAAVEWASLPAALNSALSFMVYLTSYNSNGSTAVQSIVQGNGNGSSGNAIGLMLTRDCTGTNASLAPCPFATQHVSSYGNNAYRTQAKMTFEGSGTLALTMGTADVIYLNGNPSINTWNTSPFSSAGLQTVGNYQIGGSNSGAGSSVGTFTNFVGQIYYAAFWNRVLTSSEVAAAALYMQNAMAARGVPPSLGGGLIKNTNNQFVLDGDSIAAGPLGTIVLNGTWQITDVGLPGETLATVNGVTYGASLVDDPTSRPGAERNVTAVWAGTNDNCTTAAACAFQVGNLRNYCLGRRAVGYKCLVLTMLSRTSEDASKDLYNPEMRLQWPTFADGLVDEAADPLLGADGASSNTTYFPDGIHPSGFADANNVVPIIQRAINRLYGNKDFSSATVYTSAATAAVATTAGSQTGSVVTITITTPANCQVGNTMTLAGVTPAGYNGNWTIMTRSGTNVTFVGPSTALGVITIQGTGVCPQQQDADMYATLNFGVGNFSLESCVGYTGQRIYLQNINAVASTLLPFGSETITGAGAAPTTLTALTTAVLESELVSSAAGTCNWRRIQ